MVSKPKLGFAEYLLRKKVEGIRKKKEGRRNQEEGIRNQGKYRNNFRFNISIKEEGIRNNSKYLR